jgi:lipid-A-disaccharide synthase
MGIPVIHYIAPKLWAWGSWRVKKLKKSQDILASILPFEVEWFGKYDIDVRYVGNPSAVSCAKGWTREALRSRLNLADKDFLLALLPGSRPGELSRHSGLMAEAGKEIVKRHPNVKLVTTRAPGVRDEQLQPLIDAGVRVVERTDEGYAMRADAAVAASGTATLELALWDTPTVLVYRSGGFTMWLGRKLLRTRCVGLANILLDDTPVMPELLQENATVEKITSELELIIAGDGGAIQRKSFTELKSILTDRDPSEELAKIVLEKI